MDTDMGAIPIEWELITSFMIVMGVGVLNCMLSVGFPW